jgi:hypothetical protein
MDELISLVAAIYECLKGVSIRSLIYAVADVYARSQLGEVNREKLIEILAQNLAGALRADPHAAKKMVEDAITCVQNTGGSSPRWPWGRWEAKKPPLLHI